MLKSKIKKFKDACKALKLDPKKVIPDFSVYPENHRKAMVAHAKLVIIAEVLNEGWRPDWSNFNEGKYYPWFELKKDKKYPSGSGFAFIDYVFWNSYTHAGSRLCFKDAELAKYAGKQFEDLYNEYFSMN